MRDDKFIELTMQGETSRIEFKSCSEQVSESVYETVCSFLNHSGGYILLGVRDDGEIIGVNPHKAEDLKSNIITTIKNKELFLPCPYFTPQVLEVGGKVVLLLEIPYGQYVYRYRGRYWDRNDSADIDITDNPELLLSLFERKNPHLFEERVVDGAGVQHLDQDTFKYCRNILATSKPEHAWLQLDDKQILLATRLAKKDSLSNEIKLKYAALVLFGKEDAIEDFLPRYRFEAVFHTCTYEQYNDFEQFPSRYDDRITLRRNLIQVYDFLTRFTERYLPDKFYLPQGTTQRQDLRWNLFREIVANLCVHADYSSGYACFYHVFKDRVITKNPSRLLGEVSEGQLSPQQLSNYTKNPLLVRVFRELSLVEDMGSGMRNILRYAPLYYPDYKIEINNGSQFVFSITYMDVSQESRQMSQETVENEPRNAQMNQENEQNEPRNAQMNQESAADLDKEDWKIPLGEGDSPSSRSKYKKHKRQKGIVGLIKRNPQITIGEMAETLSVSESTIKRDIDELKDVVKHLGSTKGGHWMLLK